MQLVVIAGGLGERLARNGVTLPKILLKCQGKTLLERIIEEAEHEKFTSILFCLGHKSDEIVHVLNGLSPNIEVKIYIENNRLGTLGALVQSIHELESVFAVVLGDLLIFNTNLGGLAHKFLEYNDDALALIKNSVHPNDSDLVNVSATGMINQISKYPHKENISSFSLSGVYVLKKSILSELICDSPADLADYLAKSIGEKSISMRGIFHQGYIKDLGTTERLRESENICLAPETRLSDESLVIFDRDGTLIENVPYLGDKGRIKLLSHSRELGQVSTENFDNIAIASNQPGIARGDLTIESVEEINTLVCEKIFGSYSRNVLVKYCPHHPDKGFPGERVHLKRNCFCRKPNPGLLLDILDVFKTRAQNSLFVGDSVSDLAAAEKVAINWVHLSHDCQGSNSIHPECFKGICASSGNITAILKRENSK